MVRWAFHTILGHYVVTDAVIEFHQRIFPTFQLLCDGLLNSSEFAANYAARSGQLAALAWDAAPRAVITGLYRHTLKREPDPGEIADGCALLRQMGGLEAVGALAAIYTQMLGQEVPGAANDPQFIVAMPEQPPAPWRFVGRERQMAGLLHWFLQGERRRLFLEGPDGAGRTALAVEFGRRLVAASPSLVLPGGAPLGHVIFVGGEGTDAAQPALRILQRSGWVRDQDLVADAAVTEFLAGSSGLVVIDDRHAAGAAGEQLLIQILAANRHNRVLYTHSTGQNSGMDQTIQVAGFSSDAEYAAFLEVCAARFGTATPEPADYEAIARWSHGLPRRIEALFDIATRAGSFAQALTLAGGRPG